MYPICVSMCVRAYMSNKVDDIQMRMFYFPIQNIKSILYTLQYFFFNKYRDI